MTRPAGSPRDYEAYGLRVRSPVPLPFARGREDPEDPAAAGEPDVVVRLGAVPAALAGPADRRRAPGGHAVWEAAAGAFLIGVHGVARYLVTGGREVLVEPRGGDAREIGASLAGTVWAALLLQRGIVPFHASAVEFEAGAVLFLGRSGAGKSSLLGALLKRGHAMLADDVAGIVPDSLLRGTRGGAPIPSAGAVEEEGVSSSGGAGPSYFPAVDADARPMALPAYPRLRLCADAVEALGWRGQVRERVRERARARARVRERARARRQTEKYLAPVQRFHASALPVCALFLLASHDRTGIEIETMQSAAAFQALGRYGWRKPLLKGLDRWPAHFRVVAAMARQAPVARVVRPAAGPLRLDALADRIEAHVRETVLDRA